MKRRAFATMSVILTLVLVGAAVALMTAYFAHQARRTRGVTAQAELRQLLLAAMPVAQAALQADASERTMPVETPVLGALVTLQIRGTGEVVVEATFERHRARQSLRFVSVGDRWNLEQAVLERTQGQ